MPHGNNQNMSFIDRELIKKGQGQIVLDKDSYLWKLTKNTFIYFASPSFLTM